MIGSPPWAWDGAFVKPHGGYRLSIRFLPNHQVETYSDISWWQRAFFPEK